MSLRTLRKRQRQEQDYLEFVYGTVFGTGNGGGSGDSAGSGGGDGAGWGLGLAPGIEGDGAQRVQTEANELAAEIEFDLFRGRADFNAR